MSLPMSNSGYTDNLDAIVSDCWQRLHRGAKDRRHGFHQLTIGNVDREGQPHQRIMVLREADSAERLLRFHTDARAAKVDMISDGSPISILAYDARAKIQIRMHGNARIEQQGPRPDCAWEKASLFARRCYLADPAPGSLTETPSSGLPADLEGIEPTQQRSEHGRNNFALLLATINRMEWLYLAHTGHRRAQFIHDADSRWHGHWMVP
ncbi:MAG: pyridoxamine 5'-phosphate oxidase family protein [Pseudomonadota bacterium]